MLERNFLAGLHAPLQSAHSPRRAMANARSSCSESSTSRPGPPKRGDEALTIPAEELLTLDRINTPSGRGPEEGGVNAIRKNLCRLGAEHRAPTALGYALTRPLSPSPP